MNRSAQFLLVSCCMLLLISGCSKPYKKPDPVPTTVVNPGSGPGTFPQAPGPSLNELFKEFRSTPEVKCVTAGILQTLTFAKGTRLTFYPNSFKDAAGAIITSGTVCIEMVEMYKPGDMIANGTTTSTVKGELLESGGQVKINATKDGQKVYANTYDIAFPQPAPSTKAMDVYYGNSDNADSIVKWEVFTGSNGGNGTWNDSAVSGPKYIFFNLTNFGFINCDRLHNTSAPRTQVKIILPDSSYFRNTCAFVVLHDLNATVLPTGRSFIDHCYYVGDDLVPLNKVPLGLRASVVVISRINTEIFYYEQTGLTITEGLTIKATPTKQSLDYIKAKLSAL